jgi:hypothetical protein
VIHRVEAVGDPWTLPTSVFDPWTSHLQSMVAAGTVRVVTFNQAMTPP